MTDQLKEFYNADIGYADIKTGVDIVTTAANETAVVKDVLVSSSLAGDLNVKFRVGGTTVASVNKVAKLSGTEIIGPSSALNAKVDQLPWQFNAFQGFTKSAFTEATLATVFNDKAVSNTANTTSTTISSALTVSPEFACFSAAGDFYYASAAGGTLYKRTGGINGAQTAAASGFYTPVYDGSRYIYGMSGEGGYPKRYDTQTDTTDGSGTCGNYYTNFGQIATIDDYVFVHGYYTGTSHNYIVKPSTGVVTNFASFSNSSAVRYYSQIGKNTGGDYIAVVSKNSPGLNWWNLGKDLALARVVSSGTISMSSSDSHSDSNRLFRNTNDPSKMILVNNNLVSYNTLDLDMLTSSSTAKLTGFGSPDAFIPVWDESVASLDFGSVRIRATGVLSTEA